MVLCSLRLFQFKNLDQFTFHPGPGMNFIIGENGMGKTNLLDAIHFCCLTKSYFQHSEKLCIEHTKDYFRIESDWKDNQNEEHEVVVKCTKSSGREVSWDKVFYKIASEHLGKIPVVMIVPDEVYTFVTMTEERRKFLNYCLIQTDKEYLRQLNLYNQQYKQRLILLKNNRNPDASSSKLLDVYESSMASSSEYIVQKRKLLISELNPLLNFFSEKISSGQQSSKISYNSNAVDNDLLKVWKEERYNDAITGRTRTGIHRDKLDCIFNDQSIQSFGSQGQIKTFVIALRLAQMKYLESNTKLNPVLLLDDLFAKLDEERVAQLLKIIEMSDIKQCFISDTNLNRAKKISSELNIPCTLHQLQNNKISIYEKK